MSDENLSNQELTLKNNISITKKNPMNIIKFISNIFGKSKKTISVIRLDGVIGKVRFSNGLSLDSLNHMMEKAFKAKPDAICFSVNSPGGSPVQSEFISARIKFLSKKYSVPTYCFVEDVAASGGYFIASAIDEIYASKSSVIGSIGVISSSFGFTDAIKKLGVERRVYTQGDNKSVLDPFSPAKEEDIKIIKKLQKKIHEVFIEHVKLNRRAKLTQEDNILFNGLFWDGQTALDYGLIDGIDNLYSFIDRKFGSDAKINYIVNKQGFFKKLFKVCFGNAFLSSKLISSKSHLDESKDNIENISDNLVKSFVDQLETKILYDKYKF